MSTPAEVVNVQTDTLTFIHRKETRHYTRFICVAYNIPPHFLGVVGDIFLTSAEPTSWVRTQYGWKIADKTTEEDGVPRETHPQFSAYIRLDPSDSKWKGTRTFRPKISRGAQKVAATQEEVESASNRMMGLFKGHQTETMATLDSFRHEHARYKAELETLKEQHAGMKLELERHSGLGIEHTRTKAELDALKVNHLGLKGELGRLQRDLRQDYAGNKTGLDTLKNNYAELKGELGQLGGFKKGYMVMKAELDALKVEHVGTKAELDQSKAAIQSAEAKIKTLENKLASPSETMAVDNQRGKELDEVKEKLQAAELTIQELRDQVASTSANLDALIALDAPRITKVMWHVRPL